MRHRRTILGVVIVGLLLGLLLVLWNGKKMTYVDSSGYWFLQKTELLGLEIPTRRWSVPRIGEPEPSPDLPWVKYAARPLFFMRGTLHYEAGEKVVDERREAEFKRVIGD
jgi:hypothetical protein